MTTTSAPLPPDIADTLFVSDLDGTLLDPSGRVSDDTRRLLTALAARGVTFTCATARTPATVVPLLSGIPATAPAIVMTGASLYDRATLSYIHPRLLPAATATAVAAECRSAGLSPFVYSLAPAGTPGPEGLLVYHHPAMTPHEERFVDERRHLQLKRFVFSGHTPGSVLQSTLLLFVIGAAATVFDVADRLRRRGDCSVSAYTDMYGPEVGLLEVMAPGVSKAAAVKALAERLGKRRIVVYGDNLNDIPMMELATESYAVANAIPQVLSCATGIIGPNTGPSVALHISRLAGMAQQPGH